MRLILASGSSYRKALLERLAIPFEVVRPVFEEKLDGQLPVAELVRYNTLGKARAVSEVYSDSAIIASDQVACCGEKILGKPGNYEAAFAQLKMMSGRKITFLTGIALIRGGNELYDTVRYHVHMRILTDEEIACYLKVEQPYDCAGSFKSEGLGVALFERMEGDDPTALVGLPLISLSQWLQPLKQ